MRSDRRSETAWRAVAAAGISLGAGAAVAPGPLSRLAGLPAGEMTGTAALGLRLFAVRSLVVGDAALTGSRQARRIVLPIQLLDEVVFFHTLATGSVPRRLALMAIATSGAAIAACLAASHLEQAEHEVSSGAVARQSPFSGERHTPHEDRL